MADVELKGFKVIRDAAKAIGVHRTTLHRWLREGTVQVFVIAGQRFIPESEIERLKKERENEGLK
jgi:predicted site-specific integrase-resolvase